MNHVDVADVTNGQSTHTEKHPEGDWVREEKNRESFGTCEGCGAACDTFFTLG